MSLLGGIKQKVWKLVVTFPLSNSQHFNRKFNAKTGWHVAKMMQLGGVTYQCAYLLLIQRFRHAKRFISRVGNPSPRLQISLILLYKPFMIAIWWEISQPCPKASCLDTLFSVLTLLSIPWLNWLSKPKCSLFAYPVLVFFPRHMCQNTRREYGN